MNFIKIGINLIDVSDLTPNGSNLYPFTAVFQQLDGNPLGDARVPNSFSTSVPLIMGQEYDFLLKVPIEDGNYTIDSVRMIVHSNDNSSCCIVSRLITITNTVPVTPIPSTPMFGITYTNAVCSGTTVVPGKLVISDAVNATRFKIAYNTSVFNAENCEQSDGLINSSGDTEIPLLPVPAGTSQNFVIRVYNGSGCLLYTDNLRTQIAPNCAFVCITPVLFSFRKIDPTCSASLGDTNYDGKLVIEGWANATHYQYCIDSTFTCTPIFENAYPVVGNGEIILDLPLGFTADQQYRDFSIRMYNTVETCFHDESRRFFNPCYKAVVCPPDNTWQQNSEGTWYKKETATPTTSPSGYTIVAKRSEYYAIDGSRLYNQDLTTFETLTTPLIWAASGTNSGPMNRCSVWTNKQDLNFPVNDIPMKMWLGFSKCLTGLTIGKTYYVGLEADNNFKLTVDSQIIYQDTTNTTHFRTWKIIPVVAKKTEMLISMEGMNDTALAGFGCEIYDNTRAQIIAAQTVSNLNIIFSSESKIGSTFDSGGYSGGINYGNQCADGYQYNPCTLLCEKINYCK